MKDRIGKELKKAMGEALSQKNPKLIAQKVKDLYGDISDLINNQKGAGCEVLMAPYKHAYSNGAYDYAEQYQNLLESINPKALFDGEE